MEIFFAYTSFFFLFVSCGSSFAATSQSITTVQITREPNAVNHFPPFSHTIMNEKNAQTLYNASLNLPKEESTGRARSCAGDSGLMYRLSFYQNNTLLENMELSPTGCSYLEVKAGDARPLTQSYLSVFSQTTGIPWSQIYIQPTPQTTKPVTN